MFYMFLVRDLIGICVRDALVVTLLLLRIICLKAPRQMLFTDGASRPANARRHVYRENIAVGEKIRHDDRVAQGYFSNWNDCFSHGISVVKFVTHLEQT